MYLCKSQSINVPEHLSHELIILQNIFYIKKKKQSNYCVFTVSLLTCLLCISPQRFKMYHKHVKLNTDMLKVWLTAAIWDNSLQVKKKKRMSHKKIKRGLVWGIRGQQQSCSSLYKQC